MSRLSRCLRKFFAFRTIDGEKTVIIWWGIFPWGAKVMAVLAQAEWPHVRNIDAVTEAEITASLRRMVDALPAEAIRHSQKRILQLGGQRPQRAADLIV